MSRIYNNKDKGFTLVETLISVSLIVLVAALVTSITVVTQRMFWGQKSEAKLQRDSQMVLNYMAQDVRMCFKIMSEYPEGSDAPYYVSSNNSIVLMMKAIDASGLPITGQFDYVAYIWDYAGLKKVVIKNPGSSRAQEETVLSEFVQDFDILYDGMSYEDAPKPVNTVNVLLRVAPEQDTEEDVFELQTEIMVRNSKE
jgi:prepilin-type N-terminal cleavage/methylation domain-containing protein